MLKNNTDALITTGTVIEVKQDETSYKLYQSDITNHDFDRISRKQDLH
jgi:hypothetical protein